jgi:hypothetical protein
MACAILVGTCLVALTGCRSATVENGRYASPKGYAVAVPSPGWTVVAQDEADMEWQRTSPSARMLVHGSCEDGTPRRTLPVLARQLMMGVRDRTVIEKGELTIAGRPTGHVVVEGRSVDGPERVRIEAFVVKDTRCVYDFLYAAPVDVFEASRADFRRVVDSLTLE